MDSEFSCIPSFYPNPFYSYNSYDNNNNNSGHNTSYSYATNFSSPYFSAPPNYFPTILPVISSQNQNNDLFAPPIPSTPPPSLFKEIKKEKELQNVREAFASIESIKTMELMESTESIKLNKESTSKNSTSKIIIPRLPSLSSLNNLSSNSNYSSVSTVPLPSPSLSNLDKLSARKSTTYADLQYLDTKKGQLAYYNIIYRDSKQYLIWVNNNNKTANDMYGMLLLLANSFQINVVLFDYMGKGNSLNNIKGIKKQKKNNNKNFSNFSQYYKSFKIVMKNINFITENFRIQDSNIILCGDGLGATLVNKYIKNHSYNKAILIDLPLKNIKTLSKNKKVKLFASQASSHFVGMDKNKKNTITKYCTLLISYEEMISELKGFIND